MKKSDNKKNGFTLAELLVVVAIIAILVAVSIPIFTAQRNKAIRATNQANIRAAKAAAVASLYSDPEYQKYLEINSEGKQYIYFVYNVEKSAITDVLTPDKYKWDDVNPRGRVQLAKAANNEVCDEILVFVDVNKEKNYGQNAIQTAPYYDADGKVGTVSGSNPFGPRN